MGAEEALLLRWATEHVRPGSIVWDIGANVGVFALAAAVRAGTAGRVLALEADPFLSGLLERSAASRPSGSAPITVVHAAACDVDGPVAFHVAAEGRASSHIAGAGQSTAGGTRAILEVRGVTLDSLLASQGGPTLVKIDVEGAEGAVLRGARDLLRRFRPVVLCEVAEASRAGVSSELQALGYSLYDAEVGPIERRRLALAPWNTLALPEGGA
jgi:FkbM family methyltransferase